MAGRAGQLIALEHTVTSPALTSRDVKSFLTRHNRVLIHYLSKLLICRALESLTTNRTKDFQFPSKIMPEICDFLLRKNLNQIVRGTVSSCILLLLLVQHVADGHPRKAIDDDSIRFNQIQLLRDLQFELGRYQRQKRVDDVGEKGDETRQSLFQSCDRYKVCDLRTHYCDPVISECARCDDDCHKGRIDGNPSAQAECRRNCAVWYAEQARSSTPGASASSDLSDQIKRQIELYEAAKDSAVLQSTMYIVTCASVIIATSLLSIACLLAYHLCRRSIDSRNVSVRSRGYASHKTRTIPLTSSTSKAASAVEKLNATIKTSLRSVLQPPSYDSSVSV